MISGHYTGELKTAIDDAAAQTTDREGAFYSILNKHGFYDIDDESNGLTPWQRDSVPDYNKRRMSALASAISDMIQDFLGNETYGVMTTKLEEIINKLDGFLTCTKSKTDALQAGISASGVFAPVGASAESMYTANAAAMGLNPYDIDILPPLLIGLGGLPISMGSCFPKGHFMPDLSFLYDHEIKKSPTFYESEGTVYIGAGIPLDIGGSTREMVLKKIFAVVTVDENGEPQGDVKGGIQEDQFELIMKASNAVVLGKSYDQLDDDVKGLSLTETQIRFSFYRYVQMSVWGPIVYTQNWPYYHWGMLSHNSCPEAVKTALVSYLKTAGFACDVSGNYATSAFLSYCLRTGMYYHLGYAKPLSMVPLKGDKYIMNGQVVTVDKNNTKSITVEGVPRDEKLANQYFTYIADILSRLTYGTNPEELDMDMRKRRCDEANLIYKYVGFRPPEYGTDLARIDSRCKRINMISRNLKGLFAARVLVHENVASNLPPATDVTIDNKASEGEMSTRTKNVITYLARLAGVKYLMVTSLYRSPEKQATIMFNSLQKTGQPTVAYGSRGRAVNDEYARIWYKFYGKGDDGLEPRISKDGSIVTDRFGKPVYVQKYAKEPFPPNSAGAKAALNAMIAKCKSFGYDTPVSNHTKDPEVSQCVDIATSVCYAKFPKVTEAQMKKFSSICYMSSEPYKNTPNGKQDNSYQTLLMDYYAPKGFGPKEVDPCIHLEINQKDPTLSMFDTENLDLSQLLPTIEVGLDNTNLTDDSNWDNAYAKDHNDKLNAS